MCGVILPRFTERRLGKGATQHVAAAGPGSRVVLPAVMVMRECELNLESIIILVFAFLVAGLLLSLMCDKPGIRKKPYSLLSCY